MWRTSGKLTSTTRFSPRKCSVLKQSCALSGRKIEKVVPKQSTVRHLATNATGGRGGTGAGGKLVIGVAVATTATITGGLYYASNNKAFRKNVEDRIPGSASIFNAIIGKTKSGTNVSQKSALLPPAIRSSQTRESSENPLFAPDTDKKFEPLPFGKDKLSVKPELSTNIEVKSSPSKVSSEIKLKGKAEPSASLSSVDQMAVSSVDLDISKTVEKEISEAEVDPAAKPSTKKKEMKEENEKLEKQVIAQDEKSEINPKESNETIKETVVPEKTISMETTAVEIALQVAIATASQLGEKALECHERAIEAVRLHKDCVREALENAENDPVSKDHWEVLGTLSQTKATALQEAENMADKVSDVIEKVRISIAEGKEKGLELSVEVASETLAKLTYELQQAKNHLKETQSEGTVLKQFKDYVEEDKQHLMKKIAAIRPGFQDTKLEDKADEALLSYAQHRMRVLEDALEQRVVEEGKLMEEALCKQQKEDEKLADMRLKHELERLKNELNNLMRQKEAEMAEEHENDLRKQLRRQASVFGDHLNDVLKVQANELDGKYQSEKREELLLQRHEFHLKLRGTLARLNGVMTALHNRAGTEKANSEAQELWLACQSLSVAITGLGDDRSQLYPIHDEVDRIRRVTNGNEVVGAILDSLPESVLHRGLFTEESLRRRFPFVRKVCKQVAMVGEEGGGVWRYLLSYFQSLLVFDVRALKHPVSVDPEEMDTHVILSLATSSLEEGDTEQAVRYMNQLHGEARRVARDWVQEARLFLEARQVASFLTSFASTYNIGGEQ